MQAFTAGALAVLVGYASSVAIVWQGLQAVGATTTQAAIALAALSAGQGALSLWLSLKHKTPLLFAWSTPGAALLVASGTADFSTALGAFLFAALLGLILALIQGLSWVMRLIPLPLASALLAAVLLRLAIDSLAKGLQEAMIWPVLSLWFGFFLVRRIWPSAAIFVVLFMVILWSWWFDEKALLTAESVRGLDQHIELSMIAGFNQAWTWPSFDWSVIIGLGLPLFLVTLTSQNMAGLAAIKSFGYQSNPDRLLFASSLASAIAALFGGHALNLAAITAAICLGPQAGDRPQNRWKAAAWAGVLYLVVACFALWVIKALSWMNTVLVLCLASIALIGSMTSALQQAYQHKDLSECLPQTLCLLVVLSGVNIGELGSAFWGLFLGRLAMLLQNSGLLAGDDKR